MITAGIVVGAIVGAGTGAAIATFGSDDPELTAHDGVLIAATSAPEDDDANIVTQPAEPSPSTTEPDDDETDEPKPDPPAPDDPFAATVAKAIELTNAKRADAGCGAVTANDRLNAAAHGHSADMASNGYFDHTSRDGRSFTERASAQGYHQAMSENIAAGYPDAAAVVEGWMNSPGHRQNILNCDAKAVGLGVAQAADGTLYWTQMFGRE